MDYCEQFELHVAPLAHEERMLLEDIFLNRLKEEIKAEIKLYGYDDLSSLMGRALLLEENNQALHKKNKGMPEWRGNGSKYRNTWDNSKFKKEEGKVIPKEEKEGNKPGGTVRFRRLPTSEWEEKMKLGLYFKCGDKWVKGHVCKFKHMKLMLYETGSDSEEEEEDTGGGDGDCEVREELKTLQSKEGLTSNKSFKVWGEIDGKLILTLLDSGASSNFISPRLVKALSLQVFDTPVYVVETGIGEQVQNQGICRNLKFKVQGIEFHQNFFLIELGGTDMVLGMDWLASLGDVEANFRNLSLKWKINGEKMAIQGEPSLCNAEVSWKAITKTLSEEGIGLMVHCQAELIDDSGSVGGFEEVLREYDDVFEMPTGLPPQRAQDHAIVLQPGSSIPHASPYRYPHYQKNEIEKTVKEMMQAGIVRPNTSPFSSPVILVKKEDGGWGMEILH